MSTLNPKYRYGNRESLSTLGDFNLLAAARPVMYRDREIKRKREARRLAREQKRLTIICANGQVIRPIK